MVYINNFYRSNLLFIIVNFFCFSFQLKFNVANRKGNKKLLMKIYLTIRYMPYHPVVCFGAINFPAWSTVADQPRKYWYLGHAASAITYTFRIICATPRWTLNPLHCRDMTLLIAFSPHSPQTSLPLLTCPPFWLLAKSLKWYRKNSPRFWTTSNFVFRPPVKTSWKRITCSPYLVPLLHGCSKAKESSMLKTTVWWLSMQSL